MLGKQGENILDDEAVLDSKEQEPTEEVQPSTSSNEKSDPLHVERNEELTEISEEELAERRFECARLKSQGNECFKLSEMQNAIGLYTEAIEKCPRIDRKELSILYSNRAAALLNLDDKSKNLALEDCSKSIELNPEYIKPYMRRACIYRSMGDEHLDSALADYQKVLELDPNIRDARVAVTELNKQIDERNDRMKAEMMDNLKTLGNKFLNVFGLSTDNFELNKNEETGGYSINFRQ